MKSAVFSQRMPSFGRVNQVPRTAETHPLTWRLRDDGQTVWLDEYRQKGGYRVAETQLAHKTPEDICRCVKEAGLKGRGGAGFLAGIKWSLTARGEGIPAAYLVCNADEMEPNTFKDRMLLEQLPHLLIEGMILAGYANQAVRGFIFLRGEYVHAARVVERAIGEAREAGLLGAHIAGTDYSFDLQLHVGAGRYICGEETALLNALEGRRANPRAKPPFPGQAGAWGRPTVVNNVETLCNVPVVLEHGPEWYQALARPESGESGTKLMGFAGAVRRPGIWEVPFGISARELFEDYAGGMRPGYRLKAWQPGGASTGFLLPEDLDLPMSSAGMARKGLRLGTALALAVDDRVSMVALLHNIESFFSRESCGWCTPCREGLAWAVKLLSALKDGRGRAEDIQQLEKLVGHLQPGMSFCGLAPGASEPLRSALALFRDEFEATLARSPPLPA